MTEFTRDAIQRTPVTNKRSFFLCYECGEVFQLRAKYEEHILLHQAILFCYQIYEYETDKMLSNVAMEGEKSFKKGNLNSRTTIFPDFIKKRANKLFELSATGTSTCSVLGDKRSEGRKGSVGRPQKRKRVETIGTALKLVKKDRLDKPKSSVAEGSSRKDEECVKESLNDDRSRDANFLALSTTPSAVSSVSSASSTTSSSSFFSPPSDSSSVSSDSTILKKKSMGKTKRVNISRDKDYSKDGKNSTNDELNTFVDEETKVADEVKDDFLHSTYCQKKDVVVKNETDDSKEVVDEMACCSFTDQMKLKSKTRKRCDDLLENRITKSEKIDKKLQNEFKTGNKKGRSSRLRTLSVKGYNLKEATLRSDSSPEAKVDSSKPNAQPFSNNCSLGQKCVACDFVSFQGTEMIEHVTKEHDASVVKLEKKDCVDGVWSGSSEIKAEEKCALCDLVFNCVSDYFIHVILLHKPSLFAPEADRFTCTAHLAHPHLPTHKINITLKKS